MAVQSAAGTNILALADLETGAVKPLTVVLLLLALQGVVGGVQWALELPGWLVWIHIALATGNWLAMLWTVAAAGQLEPREKPAPAEPAQPAGATSGVS